MVELKQTHSVTLCLTPSCAGTWNLAVREVKLRFYWCVSLQRLNGLRRGKSGVSPCGLSGLCAGALISACVGSQSLSEPLGVPPSVNIGCIALRGRECQGWHSVLSAFSCKATSTQQLPHLLLTLLLEHAPCLKASLRYSRLLQNCLAWPKSPHERGSL